MTKMLCPLDIVADNYCSIIYVRHYKTQTNMKRKLIKQGAGGLTVCLPKKWVDENNLKPGEEIDLVEEDHKLSLSAKTTSQIITQVISIDNPSYDFLRRIITNAYKKGVDELKLNFVKEVPTKDITNALSSLTIGYEMTELGKNSCLIRSFSREETENIQITTRKCFLLIKEMQTIINEDLNSRHFSHLQTLEDLNYNVRRLANYALRTTVKTIKNVPQVQYNTTIFSNIYLYSIKLVKIYFTIKKEKVKPATGKILTQLFSLFEHFYDSYYQQELGRLNEMIALKLNIERQIDQKINSGDGRTLLQASMALRCIHDSLGALIGKFI